MFCIWEYVTKLCLRFLFNIDPAHNTVRWASLNIKRCFYQQSLLLSLSPKQLTALRLYEKWLKSQNRVKSQTFAAATTSLAYARSVHKHYWLLQGLLVNEKKNTRFHLRAISMNTNVRKKIYKWSQRLFFLLCIWFCIKYKTEKKRCICSSCAVWTHHL